MSLFFSFHIVNPANILVWQLTFDFALTAECKPLGRAGKSLLHIILTSHALCQTQSIYIAS